MISLSINDKFTNTTIKCRSFVNSVRALSLSFSFSFSTDGVQNIDFCLLDDKMRSNFFSHNFHTKFKFGPSRAKTRKRLQREMTYFKRSKRSRIFFCCWHYLTLSLSLSLYKDKKIVYAGNL